MKELLNILAESRRLASAGKPYALATVVKIGGSTYRRPGARMLTSEDGAHWGTISGGCLEGEVAMQALNVLESGRAQLIPFDLEDDDIVLGFGAGCNGIVHVLIQPIDNAGPSPVEALNQCIVERRSGVLATVISDDQDGSDRIGTHLLQFEGGNWGSSSMPSELVDAVTGPGRLLLDQEINTGQMYLWHTDRISIAGHSIEVLYEIVRPPIHLYIFGEGHDVRAVVDQATLMGWQVTIVGRKPIDVLQHRFPTASDWIFMMHPEQAGDLVDADSRSSALVMNHTYVRDRTVLQALLTSAIPFIGMLGPRERTSAMVEELAEEGIAPESEDWKRVFGPVGLDVGTETPEEIALAAIAEIQAVLHHRDGGSLRNRNAPIHAERNPIESFY